MKKLGSLFTILVILFAFGCSGGSGSGGKKDKDPCAGPVPCLTEEWGYIDEGGYWIGEFAIFMDGTGTPILLITDGETFAVGGYYEVVEGEIGIVAFEGPVRNCYSGTINLGGWADNDGNIIGEFTSASGNVKVCGETITISKVVVEGEIYPDVVGTFDSMGTLSLDDYLSTNAPISTKSVDDVKIRIKMLEQLMPR
jgi:hypothetical protein